MLKSTQMALSAQEMHWLPWFGKLGKLSMRWSCYLNESRYPVIESTFEGIAATRVKLLQGWAEAQWGTLDNLAQELQESFPDIKSSRLAETRELMEDFSEIGVADSNGRILASTATSRAADRLGQAALGRISTGAVADLVVLDEDPTENVSAYRRVASVYLGGVKVR